MYPKYPLASVRGLNSDKLPHTDLMAIWDRYSSVLPLVPKTRGKTSAAKKPHWHFWQQAKEDREAGIYLNVVPDRELAARYQARNDVSGWCVPTGREHRILVVDLDPSAMDEQPETVYERIQGLSPTSFIFKTPSNGVHLFYRVPEDRDLPTNSAKNLPKGVDIRCEGGHVVTVGGVNYYQGKKAKDKGVPDGHQATYEEVEYGYYGEIPVMTEALYQLITHELPKPVSAEERRIAANNYQNTETGKARLEAHFKQPLEDRERIVAEALKIVLDNWTSDKSYEDWLQLWMSAHHGSDGSTKIRDIFLLHPNVYWSDGEEGRQKFIRLWSEHKWRTDGYTIASLFWLAKQDGWMSYTGYEIDDKRMLHINYRFVGDWVKTLETIPERLLLMSQTGSGKTYNIKNLFERLGSPKTVILVPTRKLATELAMTLIKEHGLPVTLYRDKDTNDIIDIKELADAHILVTTLQTFATKVHVPMSEYGLVYVEESDQLLAQFARGGGGYQASHVDDNQARRGFSKIRDAMQQSGVVWFVDATMSKVSQVVAEQMYDGYIDIVSNTYVKEKAPVTILPDKGMAYQEVLKGLISGKRVVVCSDTAREAEQVREVMEAIGALRGKKSIVITRHTENRREVRKFMQNVNLWSSQYDLVCYNSVMASGVSITQTRPDIIVQISTYLAPRINLQILNRYRNQNRVFVYYMTTDNIYAQSSEQVIDDMERRAMLESVLINMPISKRVPDAELRALVASISIADTQRQFRTPRDFYASLLERDGRKVTFLEKDSIFKKLKHTIDEVREARKALKDVIAATWHEVEPIDEYRPANPDYTALQVAQGEAHAKIERALRGHIPEGIDPKHIHDVVSHFHPYGFILTAFIKQELALKRSEYYLADSGRSLLNLMNSVTLIRLLTTVSKLFYHSGEVLSRETVAERADDFLNTLTLAKDSYDNVIMPNSQKYNAVYEKNADDKARRAIAYAKILLAKIGLKLRTKKVRVNDRTEYHYHIENIEEARQFLLWRNADDTEFKANIQFDDSRIADIVDNRAEAYKLYSNMDESTQAKVFGLVDEHNDFQSAITVLQNGGTLQW